MGGVTVRDVDVSGYFSSSAIPLYTSFMFGFVRGISTWVRGKKERERDRGGGMKDNQDFA
jgi:hypothetical protein